MCSAGGKGGEHKKGRKRARSLDNDGGLNDDGNGLIKIRDLTGGNDLVYSLSMEGIRTIGDLKAAIIDMTRVNHEFIDALREVIQNSNHCFYESRDTMTPLLGKNASLNCLSKQPYNRFLITDKDNIIFMFQRVLYLRERSSMGKEPKPNVIHIPPIQSPPSPEYSPSSDPIIKPVPPQPHIDQKQKQKQKQQPPAVPDTIVLPPAVHRPAAIYLVDSPACHAPNPLLDSIAPPDTIPFALPPPKQPLQQLFLAPLKGGFMTPLPAPFSPIVPPNAPIKRKPGRPRKYPLNTNGNNVAIAIAAANVTPGVGAGAGGNGNGAGVGNVNGAGVGVGVGAVGDMGDRIESIIVSPPAVRRGPGRPRKIRRISSPALPDPVPIHIPNANMDPVLIDINSIPLPIDKPIVKPTVLKSGRISPVKSRAQLRPKSKDVILGDDVVNQNVQKRHLASIGLVTTHRNNLQQINCTYL